MCFTRYYLAAGLVLESDHAKPGPATGPEPDHEQRLEHLNHLKPRTKPSNLATPTAPAAKDRNLQRRKVHTPGATAELAIFSEDERLGK